MKLRVMYFVLALACLQTACANQLKSSDESDQSEQDALLLLSLYAWTRGWEMTGQWSSEFNTTITINETAWREDGSFPNRFSILGFNDYENTVYYFTDADSSFNQGKYGKIVYTTPINGQAYYCQVVFDAATLEEAQGSTAVANTDNPKASGSCGIGTFTTITKVQG